MWPYNRIIQYASDSWFFLLGNRKRTLVLGNGIDISRISQRTRPSYEKNQIKLIGVANVAIHHGFDRIIKSIPELLKKNIQIRFKIIGGKLDSPIIKQLTSLSEKLNVTDNVVFVGFQNQDYIKEAYSNADLAIGSLGLFRIGLNSSSILKIREYCLSGIPFITAGDDPDFPNDVPFRFLVPNDESIEPIVEAIESFPEKRKLFTDEEIRDYAVRHFSFEKKFKQMIDGLI